MKKLIRVAELTLAVNFLAVAAAFGWLVASGRLDKPRAAAVRELLFPPPATQPATRPVAAATQPATRPATALLDELLAKYAGRRAGEQVELIQQSIDAQAAALDRRARDLDNLTGQLLREKEELARKSQAVDAREKQFADQQRQQGAAAADKGFQETLKLYAAMPGKQVKAAFMGMPDDTAARYLQAMPPRTSAAVVKEFKTPEEQARLGRLLERIRRGGPAATTRPAPDAAAAAGPPPAAANAPADAAPRE